MISYKKLYWFHGHQCPMSTLGYRAGLMAKKLLKLKRKDYIYAHAEIHFKSCAIDGVQMSFPSTFGNGNLDVFDEGKMFFIFINKKMDKKIKVEFSQALINIMNTYLDLRKKSSKLQDSKLKDEMEKKYKDFLDFVQSSPDLMLFSFKEVE